MTKLYWQKSERNITLQDAINSVYRKNSQYLDSAIGLIYTPEKCCFVKIDGENIEEPPKEPKEKNMDIASVFEARIFTENLELRWLNVKNGEGKAVLISDTELDLCLEIPSEPLEILTTQEQCYLLWGEAMEDSANINTAWSRLISSRIGSLYVPYKEFRKRCYLKTYEYFEEDEYGNVSVLEERLVLLLGDKVC
jgi:CRISPR-associated protein (TIGR03984 family)